MPHILTRSLLTILIPGIFAVTPWLIMLSHLSLDINLPDHPIIQASVGLAFVAIIGSVFEGLGTKIEVSWDKEREDTYKVSDNWRAYLASSSDKPPIGYRYLSKLITGLYFELAMLFAAPCFLLGAGTFMIWPLQLQPCPVALIILILCALSVWYFRFQARDSHKLLCETRALLNRRINLPDESPTITR